MSHQACPLEECGVFSVLKPVLNAVLATPPGDSPAEIGEDREVRIERVHTWLAQCLTHIDRAFDEETARRILRANGRACADDYLKGLGETVGPLVFEEWFTVLNRGGAGASREETRTLLASFPVSLSGKETGVSAALSRHCPAGCLEQLFGRIFGQSFRVEISSPGKFFIQAAAPE